MTLHPAPGQTHADAIATAAAAFDCPSPLELLRQFPDDDAYRAGPTPGGALFVIPALWDSMPAPLLTALRARRKTNVTGRCPLCEAVADLAAGQIAHENDCPVTDEQIGPMLAVWSRQVGRYARGRRITEDPA